MSCAIDGVYSVESRSNDHFSRLTYLANQNGVYRSRALSEFAPVHQ